MMEQPLRTVNDFTLHKESYRSHCSSARYVALGDIACSSLGVLNYLCGIFLVIVRFREIQDKSLADRLDPLPGVANAYAKFLVYVVGFLVHVVAVWAVVGLFIGTNPNTTLTRALPMVNRWRRYHLIVIAFNAFYALFIKSSSSYSLLIDMGFIHNVYEYIDDLQSVVDAQMGGGNATDLREESVPAVSSPMSAKAIESEPAALGVPTTIKTKKVE